MGLTGCQPLADRLVHPTDMLGILQGAFVSPFQDFQVSTAVGIR